METILKTVSVAWIPSLAYAANAVSVVTANVFGQEFALKRDARALDWLQ